MLNNNKHIIICIYFFGWGGGASPLYLFLKGSLCLLQFCLIYLPFTYSIITLSLSQSFSIIFSPANMNAAEALPPQRIYRDYNPPQSLSCFPSFWCNFLLFPFPLFNCPPPQTHYPPPTRPVFIYPFIFFIHFYCFYF